MAMAYDDDGGLKPNNQLEEGWQMSILETSATTTAEELQTSDLEGDDDASIDLSCSLARRNTLGRVTSRYWRRCSGERRTHRWGWQSHLYLYRSIELNWNEIVSWALWNLLRNHQRSLHSDSSEMNLMLLSSRLHLSFANNCIWENISAHFTMSS